MKINMLMCFFKVCVNFLPTLILCNKVVCGHDVDAGDNCNFIVHRKIYIRANLTILFINKNMTQPFKKGEYLVYLDAWNTQHLFPNLYRRPRQERKTW